MTLRVRWRTWARTTTLGLVAAGIALAGCGNLSGYQYLNHRQSSGSDLYFKLPSGWTVFNQQQIIDAANGRLNKSQVQQIAGSGWLTTFVGSGRASVGQSTLINGSHPSGIVEARPLSPQDQDGLSFSTLRTELLPSDPLNPPNPDPYQVLNYSTFTRPGGLRGNKMVVDIKDQSGAVSTFNQVAMVDSQTQWLYLIAVSCKASCYASNQGLINQIIQSWNVKVG
ncbi:MAG: hypothetical protein J2P59_03360 [Acidimicrobiales bacterium]|nr:hypothetical protein [Acidimicrobiales bacterium]